MATIPNIDNTLGAGQSLQSGGDIINDAIDRLNEFEDLSTADISVLDAIASLSPTNGNFIVGDGSDWVAESDATVRTSLGLGASDDVEFQSLELSSSNFSNLLLERTGSSSNVALGFTNGVLANPIYIGINTSSKSFSLVDGVSDLGSGKVRLFVDGKVYSETLSLSSSSSFGDRISLFDNRLGNTNMYGFGITPSSGMYSKSSTKYNWYIGENEGGTSQLLLDSNGLDVTNDLVVGGDTALEALNVGGLSSFDDDIETDAKIKSSSFTPSNGIFANGVGHQIDDDGNLEVKSLKVNGTLSVEEFIARQTTVIGGREILSVGTARVAENVSHTTGGGGELESEVIRVETLSNSDLATSFVVGDLVAFAQIDINDPTNLRRVEYRVVNETSATSGSTLSDDEVELVPDGNFHGSPATTANLLQESDFLVIYGNIGSAQNVNTYSGFGNNRVGTDGRDSIIKRSVLGNPLVTVQSGVNTYSKGFGAGANAVTQIAYGDLNGVVSGISSKEIGIIIGDTSLSGNHVLFTENQSSLKQDTFNLDTGNLKLNSTADKKFQIIRSTKEIINIGDFDFGSYEETLLDETATSSVTDIPNSTATGTNNATTLQIGLGGITSNVSGGGSVGIVSREYDLAGKWVRVQFDWKSTAYDFHSVGDYAMGYTITHPFGTIENLTRDKNGAEESGSYDSDWVFVPEGWNSEVISVRMLAPVGGITTSDDNGTVEITNLSVQSADDTYTYTDIGNDGFRSYSAGGRNVIDFSGDNAMANFKNVQIGLWEFKPKSNGDLGLYYDGVLKQTFSI